MSMDPSLIHELDPTLHEKSRLSIAFVLSQEEVLSFIELKNMLGMTDGNLCVHIKTLEKRGYLTTTKTKANGKMRTTCRLSESGKKALLSYLESLQTLVNEVRGPRHRRRGTPSSLELN